MGEFASAGDSLQSEQAQESSCSLQAPSDAYTYAKREVLVSAHAVWQPASLPLRPDLAILQQEHPLRGCKAEMGACWWW